MKKHELLVPAGNMECLRQAVFNGCDAVYLACKSFGARKFANNFTEEELMLARTNNTSTATQVETEQTSDYSVPATLALIPMKDRGLEFPRKGLRFSYKLNKRIRLMLYKLFRNLPNFITGNYRRRLNL